MEQDIPRILEMGARSLAEGPYREQIDEPANASQLALTLIKNSNGRILLYEEAGEAVGLLAIVVYPHYFSGVTTAQEVMWWVEPEHRASFGAIALLRAGETVAREMGAVRMQFTAPTPEVGRLYELSGYKQIEIGYQRDLRLPREPQFSQGIH